MELDDSVPLSLEIALPFSFIRACGQLHVTEKHSFNAELSEAIEATVDVVREAENVLKIVISSFDGFLQQYNSALRCELVTLTRQTGTLCLPRIPENPANTASNGKIKYRLPPGVKLKEPVVVLERFPVSDKERTSIKYGNRSTNLERSARVPPVRLYSDQSYGKWRHQRNVNNNNDEKVIDMIDITEDSDDEDENTEDILIHQHDQGPKQMSPVQEEISELYSNVDDGYDDNDDHDSLPNCLEVSAQKCSSLPPGDPEMDGSIPDDVCSIQSDNISEVSGSGKEDYGFESMDGPDPDPVGTIVEVSRSEKDDCGFESAVDGEANPDEVKHYPVLDDPEYHEYGSLVSETDVDEHKNDIVKVDFYPNSQNILQCESCSKTFYSKMALNQHNNIYHTTKDTKSKDVIRVKKRRKKRTSAVNLMKELGQKVIVGEDEVFSCSLCDKQYATDVQLKRHLFYHQRKTYKCDTCTKSFLSEESLDRHTSIAHTENNLTCDHCGKVFEKKEKLKQHLITHSTSERSRFTCSECGKELGSKASLKQHMVTHTGQREFACDTCGKEYTQKSSLDTHMRCHTGEMPYVCAVCNKGFRVRYDLTVHMRLHTGERPYICQMCGRGFKMSQELRRHLRTHREERPYGCASCDKT